MAQLSIKPINNIERVTFEKNSFKIIGIPRMFSFKIIDEKKEFIVDKMNFNHKTTLKPYCYGTLGILRCLRDQLPENYSAKITMDFAPILAYSFPPTTFTVLKIDKKSADNALDLIKSEMLCDIMNNLSPPYYSFKEDLEFDIGYLKNIKNAIHYKLRNIKFLKGIDFYLKKLKFNVKCVEDSNIEILDQIILTVPKFQKQK